MNLGTILCCILALLNCGYLNAQEFGSADSHWVYNRDGRNGITEIVFEKDTIIDNLPFNKFDRKELWVVSGDTTIFYFNPLFLNNTDGVVLYSENGLDTDTLINYNSVPGDSWTLPHRISDFDFKLNVQDTFVASFRGFDYRALSYTIDVIGLTNGSFVDTIYEHWGFRHSYILPYDFLDERTGAIEVVTYYVSPITL